MHPIQIKMNEKIGNRAENLRREINEVAKKDVQFAFLI